MTRPPRSAFLVLVLLVTARVLAHDPGLSKAALTLEEKRLEARVTFAPLDVDVLIPLDADGDEKVSVAEFLAASSDVEKLATRILEVRFDGEPVPGERPVVELDEENNVHLRVSWPRPTAERIEIRSTFIASLPVGHRQHLSLVDAQGKILRERFLDATVNRIETSLTAPTTEQGPFWQFLALGVEHILIGYDHILFLLALLVVGGSFWTAAGIITSFTVAHSITLALATFDLVQLPSSVVEPLIAASIVYVGFENLFRRRPSRRWLLTFAFGLIHGLGFAAVLRELGVGVGGSVVAPLLGFNLGVEVGQICIALVVLPLVWKLGQFPKHAVRFATAASVAVMATGAYWLVERTL